MTPARAGVIGLVQGLCLPFRGFSRSGATISTGMLSGASKERAERFSFALAVVLTPPAIAREVLRLMKASHEATATGRPIDLHASLVTGLLGAFFAFLAGYIDAEGYFRTYVTPKQPKPRARADRRGGSAGKEKAADGPEERTLPRF